MEEGYSVRLLLDHQADVTAGKGGMAAVLEDLDRLKGEETRERVRKECRRRVLEVLVDTRVTRPSSSSFSSPSSSSSSPSSSGPGGDRGLPLLPLPIAGGHIVLYELITEYMV